MIYGLLDNCNINKGEGRINSLKSQTKVLYPKKKLLMKNSPKKIKYLDIQKYTDLNWKS
jgi:hypothetical protein